MWRRGRGVLGAAIAVMACGGGDEAPARRVVSPLSCADASQLAVPSGFAMDDADCVTVGAVTAPTTGEWPALPDGAPMPVRYVSPRGSAGADGTTPERASADLAAAIAALGAGGGTVMVARGELSLSAAVSVMQSVWVVGTGSGASGTALRASAGAFAESGGAALTVMHTSVRPATTAATRAAFDAAMGCTLTLDDVLIDAPTTAVIASGAMIEARRVTVRGASGPGISVQSQSRLVLRQSVVRDGRDIGVLGVSAQVHLREVLVLANGRQGVALRGGAEGAAMPCASDGSLPMGGPTDCFERVEVRGNHAAGMQFEGAARGVPAIIARRIVANSTQRDASGHYGYGVVVQRQARLELDADISDDARMGLGSQFVGNVGGGVVLHDHASGALNGARVASNDGPGVFVQVSSDVDSVGYGRFDDNAAVAIGVTATGTLAAVTCNGISSTREAPLLTDVGMRAVGDGISLFGQVDRATRVLGNTLRGNARFGVLVVGGAGESELRDNTADATNRYGLGLYETGWRWSGATPAGREPAPTVRPPIATDAPGGAPAM